MARGYKAAEYNFWKNPELVEKLLFFLDPGSLKCLAGAHKLTLETLQRAPAWKKLLRRTFLYGKNRFRNETKLEEKALMANARALAEILRMAEHSKPLELDLLHMICKRFPPDKKVNSIVGTQLVTVRCSCNQTHSVGPLGFLLLEEVEATLGSEKQSLVNVQIDQVDESLLVALSCRAKCRKFLSNLTFGKR